jgi:hypothetical protein
MKTIVSRLCQLITGRTPASKGKYSPPINQMSEFAQKLVAAGWISADFNRVIGSKGNVLADDLLYVNRNGIYVPNKVQKAAKEIMGKNILGIEDAIEHFKVRPSRSQLAALSEIPYSEAKLKACKDTHVLVADFQLSIVQMIDNKLFRHLIDDDTQKLEDSWLKKHGFAWNEGATACWRLVRIEPEDDSFNKSWVDQLSMFGSENDPAPVRVAIYAAIGYFLKTGERMFKKGMSRCAELDMNGRRITVGPFKEDGLRVQAWWDDVRYYETGAASVCRAMVAS